MMLKLVFFLRLNLVYLVLDIVFHGCVCSYNVSVLYGCLFLFKSTVMGPMVLVLERFDFPPTFAMVRKSTEYV